MPTRHAIKVLLGLAFVGTITTVGYLSFRNTAMDRLYAEAAGNLPFYRGPEESKGAVKKLAAYRGRRSTSLLLDIALRENPLAPKAQTEAIKALQQRQDPQIGIVLATLLQPHEGLRTRETVADALKQLPCIDNCVRSILHYLERVSHGDPNHEDRIIHASEDNDNSLKDEQKRLYETLYAVLRRENMSTLAILAQVYGLGTSDPSIFALDLLSRLQLREACPYLLQSERQMGVLSPKYYRAPRSELQTALASSKCK